ncbi:hypothetical protein, partial [Pseudomonas poae]|uniref:hypothetical protein n=1 Tax=Pseudomonas poae TaxID=200451 RepID=UPI001B7FFE39
EATRCRIPRNYLFTKEFSVSTAPEVGRIIDVQNLPSTLNFVFPANSSQILQTSPTAPAMSNILLITPPLSIIAASAFITSDKHP